MNKYFFHFLIVLACFSCSSTKVTKTHLCKVCLTAADGVLVMPLSGNSGFKAFSSRQINDLEDRLLENFQEKGFQKSALYESMDYELLKAGIKNPSDSLQRSQIGTVLGFPYLLWVTLGSTRDSEPWDQQRPEEANAIYPIYRQPLEVSSTLRMVLIETATGQIVSDNFVFTEIHEWGTTDKDGYVNYTNLGSVISTLNTSIRKGSDFLVKDCRCGK